MAKREEKKPSGSAATGGVSTSGAGSSAAEKNANIDFDAGFSASGATSAAGAGAGAENFPQETDGAGAGTSSASSLGEAFSTLTSWQKNILSNIVLFYAEFVGAGQPIFFVIFFVVMTRFLNSNEGSLRRT